MGLPTQPVTLSPGEIQALHHQLREFRHDLNNRLSLIVAAGEIIRHKPDMAEQLLDNFIDQPQQITELVSEFTRAVERAVGVTGDPR